MAIVGFNTGRLYQADGQRISVGLAADGSTILMNDHARGIWYELNVIDADDKALILKTLAKPGLIRDKFDLYQFAKAVMNAYDRNDKHRMSLEAGKVHADSWSPLRI